MVAPVTGLKYHPSSLNGNILLSWGNTLGQIRIEAYQTDLLDGPAWVTHYQSSGVSSRKVYPPWCTPWRWRVTNGDGLSWSSSPAELDGLILPPHAGMGRISLNSVDVPSLWCPLMGIDQDDNGINWQTQRDMVLVKPAGAQYAEMIVDPYVSKIADQMDWILHGYTDEAGVRHAPWELARRLERMAHEGHLLLYRDNTPQLVYCRMLVARPRAYMGSLARVSMTLQSVRPPMYPLTT